MKRAGSFKTVAVILAFLLIISMSLGVATPVNVEAAGSMTITVSDSLISKLTNTNNTRITAVVGSVSDITGLERFSFTGDTSLLVYYDSREEYGDGPDVNWVNEYGQVINAIAISFSANITKESYDSFMADGIDSVNIQGISVPDIGWNEGWKRFSIGGEDPKGELWVGPNGEINPDTGDFTPDGTYFVSFNVTLPINDSGYKITTGGGSSHTAGASEDLKITCDGALEDLVSISVDGTVIDSANYTLESGSTILTLKAEYLNTLSAGNHTVTFTYNDGQAVNAAFTVEAQTQVTTPEQTTTTETQVTTQTTTSTSNTPTSPKTGDYTSISSNRADNTLVIVFIALVLVAGISFLAINYKRADR
ncbi:MAG: hypothetical protein IJ763_02095 [Lachnospiraceae bacterium]|nr:hypothetical protein [Lachnospiraceae bacterium]